MLANPSIQAFRYDPYSKKLTREYLDHEVICDRRANAILKARALLAARNVHDGSVDVGCEGRAVDGLVVGVIMGTLGRQGNMKVVEELRRKLLTGGIKSMIVLMSEICVRRLGKMNLAVWVQTACPRLSIDWENSILTPYELTVALRNTDPTWMRQTKPALNSDSLPPAPTNHEAFYPMDYYAANSLGPWTPNYTVERTKLSGERSTPWRSRLMKNSKVALAESCQVADL